MKIGRTTHAFVTGGASGIGLGLARALARRGAAVCLADIDGETARAAAAGLAASGARVGWMRLDVRDRAAWARAREEAEDVFGPVDLLVNNAGIAPDGCALADSDPASFERVIGINLMGVYNGIATFGAAIRDLGRGHVLNVSSMAGVSSPFPGLGAYATAKAGVVMLSEVLRLEMAPHGVGVSVLCPGMVATNLPATTLKLGGTLRAGAAPTMPGGLDPDDVGEMTAQAIEANRAYIYTHPEQIKAVEERCAGILAGFEG